jgi:hypothetical protein
MHVEDEDEDEDDDDDDEAVLGGRDGYSLAKLASKALLNKAGKQQAGSIIQSNIVWKKARKKHLL